MNSMIELTELETVARTSRGYVDDIQTVIANKLCELNETLKKLNSVVVNIDEATHTTKGAMSPEDKIKLDSIEAGTVEPMSDGSSASVGVSTKYAREDHVHQIPESVSSAISDIQSRIANIVDGGVSAGNSEKLGGQDASYYASADDLNTLQNDVTNNLGTKITEVQNNVNSLTENLSNGTTVVSKATTATTALNAATVAPKAPGTAAVGTSSNFAREDHVHPKQVVPVATQTADGLLLAADKTKLDNIAPKANAYVHPTTAGNKHIPAGGSSGQILRWSADGTAAWGADNNTTYSNMKAATASAAGAAGLVPAPAAGKQAQFLRGDGAWAVPSSANTLTTARTIAISGGATGTATSFNGSANISIPVTALNPTKMSNGTLPAGVLATNSTDYTTVRLRNIKIVSADPGAGSALTNGTICLVY